MHDELGPLPPLTLGRRTWAILRDVLPRLNEAHRLGASPLWARIAARAAAEDEGQSRQVASRRGGTRAAGAVAVIPLTGVLTPRGSFLSMLFGGAGGLQGFRAEFREAIASPDVGAVVIDIDSPGGLVDLVPETAAEIFEARGSKPIVAVANTMAASGAYWIGAQADEFVVTPSGDVGSIGVYMVHEDWSGFNEQIGIDPTYISAGPYKTEGNMDEPLSDDAAEYLQQEVDDIYSMFVGAVVQGRGVATSKVISDYGEGRTLLASRALEAGMVDRVAPLEEIVGELLGSASASGRAASRILSPNQARAAAAAEAEEEPEVEEPEEEITEPEASADEPDADKPDEDELEDEIEEPDEVEDDSAARAAMAALLAG